MPQKQLISWLKEGDFVVWEDYLGVHSKGSSSTRDNFQDLTIKPQRRRMEDVHQADQSLRSVAPSPK